MHRLKAGVSVPSQPRYPDGRTRYISQQEKYCFAFIGDVDLHQPNLHPALHCQRRQWIGWAILLAMAIGWQASADEIDSIDDKAAADDSQSRQQTSEALTAKLPIPPQAIMKLIADGNVVFDFYDEQRHNFAFAGETTFDFRYQYRCRTRYRIIKQPASDSPTAPESQSDSDPTRLIGPRQALEVTLDYEDVSLKISHRMRLPSRMVGEDFFHQRLVNHEFDHVAISADPRLPALLTRMLTARNSKVFVPLSDEEAESRDRATYAIMARNAAREETAKVFEDFASLIRIRYKELDQATRHGIEPLATETRLRLLSF